MESSFTDNMEWVAGALASNALIGVTNGFYDKKRAMDISSAGWVLMCRTMYQLSSGYFAERSPAVSSYRGEQLGSLALHLFLLAVEEYHPVAQATNSVYCDNKGALYTF